jgi:signal transduction histidine kinase
MDPEELRRELAREIEASHQKLAQSWVDRVRQQEERDLPVLSDRELADHLPELFLSLALYLRTVGGAEARAQIWQAGQAHGDSRWQQHYPLDWVLRDQWLVSRIISRELFIPFIDRYHLREGEFWPARELALRCLEDHSAGSTERFVYRWNADLERVNANLAEADAGRLTMMRTVSRQLASSLQALTLGIGILGQNELPPEHQETMRRCERSLRHMNSLLAELQEWSAVLGGTVRLEFQPINANEFALDLQSQGEPIVEAAGRQWIVRVDPTLTEFISDAGCLKQLGVNLIASGINYHATADPSTRLVLSLEPSEKGHWALVFTSEPGTLDSLKQTTQPTPVQNDLGLGPAVVRHLAALLGGEFRVLLGQDGPMRLEVLIPLEPDGRESPITTILP